MKRRWYAKALGVCMTLAAGMAWAQDAPKPEPTPDEVARLKQIIMDEQQIIADCMKRIDKLEASKTTFDKSWVPNVKLYGDLRYRYESIHQDQQNIFGNSNNPLKPFKQMDDRDRHRIRLRVGADIKANDEWNLGAQITTTQGGDPISGNQTLTSGFSKKDIWLDLAYFDYHPIKVPGLDVIGGKMKNPFYSPSKTELVWDSDLTPEGLAVRYTNSPDPKVIKPFEYYGTLGYFQIEERGYDRDSKLFGAQTGARYNFNDDGTLNLKGGVAYYDFIDTKGYSPFFDATDNFGNALTLAVLNTAAGNPGFYVNDYNLVESYAEIEFPAWRFPATVFGDFVFNTAAEDNYFSGKKDDMGWLVGMTLGKCTAPNTWAFRYNYRDVQRDAIIGAFADSDFGSGGTNARGHEIGIEYQIMKNVKAEASYFINTLDGSEHLQLLPVWGKRENIPGDYDRLQLDINVKF